MIDVRQSGRVGRALPWLLWMLGAANLARQVASLWRVRDLGFDVKIYAAGARAAAHGLSPYSAPGFVYPPSCALLVRPLAWFRVADVPHVGLVTAASAVALLALVSARAAGDRWFGWCGAITLVALSVAPPVRAVLALGNLSAVVALGFATFFLLVRRDSWVAAGCAIGLTLALKPMLAPALLVFVLEKRWKGLAAALGVPAALMAVAWFLVHEPSRFLRESVPFVSGGGDPGFDRLNAAIPAMGRVLGWPGLWVPLAQAAVVLLVVVGVTLLRRERNEVLRVVTSGSLLMAGAMLVGPLGENHYVLALVPLFAAVRLRASYLRPVVAVVCYLLLSAAVNDRIPSINAIAVQTRQRTLGLFVLVGAVVFEAVRRARGEARTIVPCLGAETAAG